MAKKDLNTWTLVPAGKWISTFTPGLLIRFNGDNNTIFEAPIDYQIKASGANTVEYRYKIAEATHHIGDNQFDNARYNIASGSGGGVDPTVNPRLDDLENKEDHSNISSFVIDNNLSIVLAEGASIRLSSAGAFSSSVEGLRSDGAGWLKNDGTPFNSFYTSGANKLIQFPDIEKTDQSYLNNQARARKYLLNAITIRVFGSFQDANSDAVLKAKYYDLDSNGNLNTPLASISDLDFLKEFQVDFENQGQSLTSRLVKANSLLVQNGADIVLEHAGGGGNLTITSLAILHTVWY